MLCAFIFLLSLIAFSVAKPATSHTTIFTTVTTTANVESPAKATTTGGTLQRKITASTSIALGATRKKTSNATSPTENGATRKASTTSRSKSTATANARTSSTTTTNLIVLTTSTTSTSTSTSTTGTTTTTSGYAMSTTFLFRGKALPSGLSASTWTVDTTPLAHKFDPHNVYVKGGYLNLLVPGGQSRNGMIMSGEVSTDFTVSSATVETYAILTNVPGVCNGMFYYEGHNQETDIEWLSSARSNANVQTDYNRAMFYTNQPTAVGGNATQLSGPPPRNPTTSVHNYKLVWVPGVSTSFYIDNVHQRTITTNVANATDGRWFWNNWSSGDPYWSAGPPKSDAVFKIQKIVMNYDPGS